MLFSAVPDPTLDEILSEVSRSFYLSLAVLPKAVRTQLSLAYLVARAADTIADTRLVRAARRLELLATVRTALGEPARAATLCDDLSRELGHIAGEGSVAEQRLLERLGACFERLSTVDAGDRERTLKVLGTLITGMEKDLTRFPQPEGPEGVAWHADPVPLTSMAELDEHTYLAAGCVGEYWTTMTAAHVPSVKRLGRPDYVARGIRLGKALQLVNVIRDAGRDLREGRSYLPMDLLERHAVKPGDLVRPETRKRGRPVLSVLQGLCLEHVDAAFPYVLAIPKAEVRLRLAALWPLWIGLATVERLRDAADPLDPAHPIKIARGDVYKIMAESFAVVGSDRLLAMAHDRRRRAAE